MSKIIHTVTLPGALVDHVLESTDAELKSIINAGKSAGRGAVRVSATRDDLEEFLTACWTLEGGPGMEASKRERAAFLRFAKALSELPQDAPAVPVEVPAAGVSEASPVDVWESEGGFSPDVYGDRRAYSQPEAETAVPDARERSTVAAGVVRDAGVEASELASELERLADRAEGLAAEAQEWSAVADGALAVAEAVRALDVVEGLSGTVGWEAVGKRESERTGEDVRAASGLVKDAGSLLRKIIGLRKTMGNASAACSGDAEMEGVCDHWHTVVVNAESDAREALGRVEAAAGTVTDAVDSIQDVIDHVCRKCGCLVTPGTDGGGTLTRDMGSCGCRAVMAARLDALGGFQPDVETVRAGRLLDADREELVEAGQLALSGCWDEAAELILEAVRYDGTGEAVAHVVAGEPTVALPGTEAAAVAEQVEAASIERERAETAAALEGYRAAGDAVRASFDVRWAVQVPPVEGVPVRVTRGGKAPVDITWSGVGRQCWSHCPDECPGMEIAEWCTCEPYPVITVDGPGEPYSWEDCARCAASTLGVSADVMADAAVRSATGVRDTVDPARVADELDAVASENAATAAFWEDGVRGQEERSAQSGVQSVQEWCASEAAAMGGYAEPYRARAVECAVWAGVFRSEATSDRVYPRRVVPMPVVALPDVVSDPSGVDVWESEGGAAGGTSGVVICHGKRGGVFPVAFRGPYAGTVRIPRSVALAGARGRLVGARVRLEAAVEYSQTCSAWAKDAADLHAEAKRSAGVLGDAVWVDSETSGRWYYRARNVETASFKRRWDAECAVRACEREIAAIEAEAVEVAERSRSGRRFLERAMSGEVPAGRGGWVSADGGTAVMFALVNDVDVNPDERYGEDNEQARAFVDLLGDAVAARDEGRTLTAKDFPTVATHGKRGAASGAHKRAVARTGQPLFKAWAAPKIPKGGKAPDAKVLQEWDEDWAAGEGVLAETEAAPGVWLPMAAVTLADVAAGNGWTVAMHRDGGRVVVRAAATLKDRAGMPAGRAGEVVAVWEGGVFDQDRSGANIAGRWLAGATLKQAFGTVANAATRPGVLAPLVLVGGSAPAPGGVSDPGGVDVWENEGGAVETPEAETPEEAWEPSAHTVLVRPMDDTDAGPRVDVYGYVGVCSCGERTWYPQKRDTAGVMAAHRDGVVRVLGGYRGGSVSGGAPEPDDYTELLPPAKSDGPAPQVPGEDSVPVPVAYAPDVVSDPGGDDGWEADGGSVPGVYGHGGWSYAERAAYAAPWPARWAHDPQPGDPDRMIDICHGPGGNAEGRRLAGAHVDAVGVEVNEGAAATARAAGFEVILADVRTLDPAHPVLRGVKRIHLSTPCPTFSTAGKHSGTDPAQVEEFMDTLFYASEALGVMTVDDVCRDFGGPHDYIGDVLEEYASGDLVWEGETDRWGRPVSEHCTDGWNQPTMTVNEYRTACRESVTDERTALMAEVLIWPMVMIRNGGILETVTLEQSDQLLRKAAPLCEAIQSELSFLGFGWVSFQIEDAADYGAATHRVRAIMVASRYAIPEGATTDLDAPAAVWGQNAALALKEHGWGLDVTQRVDFYQGQAPLPPVTMAQALGWEADLWVDTRGARKVDPKTGRVKGGGSFPADKVGQCVTATWYGATLRRADAPQGDPTMGRAFTQAQLGVLVGFRWDYPWQHVGRGEGIRNKAQQAADAISPFFAMAMAGAIFRSVAGRIWYRRAMAYQRALYRYAVHLWDTDQRHAVAEHLRNEDVGARPILRIEGIRLPQAAPTPPTPVRAALEAAPQRLALPVSQGVTGRTWWEMGERITLHGRAGRVSCSVIAPKESPNVRIIWDDTEEWRSTWEHAPSLWAEGHEPVSERARTPIAPPYHAAPRTIAPPYTPPAPVPVRALIPAPRTEPVPVASAPAAAAGLLDAFGALDRELDAARALWERAGV